MRTLPPGFAERLASGATTLARCWKLIRPDGLVMGFTDHDRSLSFDGVSFAAGTGLEAADTQAELGFAVGGGEVSGALSAASLTEADLAAGRYDDAAIEVWLVDWEDPGQRVLLDRGSLGEVRRAGSAFAVEVRSITHRLDETSGRLFQAACAADLGDARCGVPLASPAFSATTVVTDTDGTGFLKAAALAGFADGWFTGGRLAFASGANAGSAVEVRFHQKQPLGGDITLWRPMSAAIAVGDAFTVTAGCDKRFETCRDRFANTLNFRGFPHMPGNDFLLRSAREGEAGMDGGSLFK
jgi:uncharacterized phage protein (TIGR02218 family)